MMLRPADGRGLGITWLGSARGGLQPKYPFHKEELKGDFSLPWLKYRIGYNKKTLYEKGDFLH